MKAGDGPNAFVYITLGLISATALAYEILLLRVFSFSQWHHFASLAVALALLGFGAAGTTLTLLKERAIRWGDQLFIGGLLIGAFGIVAAFWIGQWISVRPLFAVWDPREFAKLLLIDFASFIPFFGFALSIGQVFARWPERTTRLYAANLFGSGLGSVAASLLLSKLYLETALILLPFVALSAGFLYIRARMGPTTLRAACGGGAILVGVWLLSGVPALPLSDFKRLAYLLDPPNARVVERLPGLRSEIRIVESDFARIAPGLSLQWTDTIPISDVLVRGADQAYPLPRPNASQDYFEATLAYLPFALRSTGAIAWLGLSEWLPPDQSRPISWIVEDSLALKALETRFTLPDWRFIDDESRRFLDTTNERFSIIFFSQAAQESDAGAEDYLLTVEGLKASLSKLEDGGIVAIPLTLSYPPRYAPKLLAMAAEALRESGVAAPQLHFAALRSMQASLILLSNQPFGSNDRQGIRDFAAYWGFDLVSLPGMSAIEANQIHQWPKPTLFLSSSASLANTGSHPEESTWFSLEIPRDARPYFWKSMRWQELPGLWRSFGSQGLIWLDWTLLATVAKLIATVFSAALLILLPLLSLKGESESRRFARVWLYFSALGLGYLLVEMAAFQRSIRYLSHPVVAASIVFAVFLIGSGIGSLTAPSSASRASLLKIFSPIMVFGLLAAIILGPAERWILALPEFWRIVSVGATLFPVSWAMGRAFPWGLRQLDQERPLIPWAWGINGFASVLAAPLALLLAVHGSQLHTWLAGVACYAVGALVALNWIDRPA